MCRNVAENFKTDFGISITGISGPEGGTEEKPMGLYYIGVRYKDKFFSTAVVMEVDMTPPQEIIEKIVTDCNISEKNLTVIFIFFPKENDYVC